jgi:hypothetical protein
MVAPALIFVEWRFASLGCFVVFLHVPPLHSKNIVLHYRKEKG